jgi:hypothetical protein
VQDGRGELLGEPEDRCRVQGSGTGMAIAQAVREKSSGDDASDVVGHQDGDRRHRVAVLRLADDVPKLIQRSAPVCSHVAPVNQTGADRNSGK